MKRYFLFLIIIQIIITPIKALADVNIFACEPEWEALAKEIGGEKVKVKTATSAFSDPHHIRARPSLIASVRQSDLVVCTGGELEIGWLPILLEKAKASVQAGEVGNLMASDYVNKLEVPEVLDRSHGDVHPGGNPHVHLNPYNIEKVAQELTLRLSKIDSDNSSYYQQNLGNFKIKWQEAVVQWEIKAKGLENMPIVVHHKNWVYLIDWLKLNQVATLEPKPGIPPSISHLEELLLTLKSKPAKAIIHAPYEDDKPSKWLSDKTGIVTLELPFTVGGDKSSDDLYRLFDSTINKLLEANK